MSADEFQKQLLHYAPELMRYSVGLTCDLKLGENLLRDSLQRALEKKKFWNPKKNLKIWILQVLHNLGADRARTQQSRGSAKLALPPIAGMDPALNAKLQRHLCNMDFEHKSVLLLTVVEKLNYKDIAGITGVPINRVMTLLHEARTSMRQVLSSHSFQTGGN